MTKYIYPSTSKEAYLSLKPEEIADIYQRIILALQFIREGTFEDIAKQAKLEPSRVWKRLGEMARVGIIYRPGTKKALRSGRNGFTWRLSEEGQEIQQVTERSLPGTTVSDFSKGIQKLQQTLF